ncbi:hypothetical protein ACQ4PT_051670 [Festuca glaucescens]
MVPAHRSYGDRAAMAEAGAEPFVEDPRRHGKKAADASSVVARCRRHAQECGAGGRCREEADEACMSNEERAVRQLVQQSLQRNMRWIMQRTRRRRRRRRASSSKSLALVDAEVVYIFFRVFCTYVS